MKMNKSKRNLLIVLVGFPFVYILYSLTPMAKELFTKNNIDFYIPFWSGIIILHWISLFIVKAFLKQENKKLKDIGYGLNGKKTMILVVSYLVLALLIFGFTEWSLNYVPIDQEKLANLSNFYPKNSQQRLFFIVMVFTAGFCEEIIYRGFAITKLSDFKINKWIAIIPAGISFVFVQGIFAFDQFLFYFVLALIFGIIFVLSKKLLPNVILHLLFNLSAMMAIFQAISR
jgi:membrane protease YdiL (CAAX protease family)